MSASAAGVPAGIQLPQLLGQEVSSEGRTQIQHRRKAAAPQQVRDRRQAAQLLPKRLHSRRPGVRAAELLQGLQLEHQEAAGGIVQRRRIPGALPLRLGQPGASCVRRLVRGRLSMHMLCSIDRVLGLFFQHAFRSSIMFGCPA